MWFDISNTCGGMWSNLVGKNRETYEENDEDRVEEWFQLTMVKLVRNGEGGRKTLGSELE